MIMKYTTLMHNNTHNACARTHTHAHTHTHTHTHTNLVALHRGEREETTGTHVCGTQLKE